jgi:hypothetical protein
MTFSGECSVFGWFAQFFTIQSAPKHTNSYWVTLSYPFHSGQVGILLFSVSAIFSRQRGETSNGNARKSADGPFGRTVHSTISRSLMSRLLPLSTLCKWAELRYRHGEIITRIVVLEFFGFARAAPGGTGTSGWIHLREWNVTSATTIAWEFLSLTLCPIIL